MSSKNKSAESKPYDVVIGLEVHVQLATNTKLFCRCSCKYGAAANTQTCPVCLGMPGSLPVMNREAFQLGMKTAIALNCEIPPFTKWDRKQYFSRLAEGLSDQPIRFAHVTEWLAGDQSPER